MGVLLFILSFFVQQREGKAPGLYVSFGKGLTAAFVEEDSRPQNPFMGIDPNGKMYTLYESKQAWPHPRYSCTFFVGDVNGTPRELDVIFGDEDATSYLTIALTLWRVQRYSQSFPTLMHGLANATFFFRMRNPPHLPFCSRPAAILLAPIPPPVIR